MDVRIGMLHNSREISLESDDSPEAVEQAVATSISEGAPLRLVDRKGSVVLVPSSTIAYVEIGAQRKSGVGFGQL